MFQFLNPKDGPVIPGFEREEIVYAKDQPQYKPLRVLRTGNDDVSVITRWTLTPEQRKAVAEGADIFLELLTFGHSLQPVRIGVGCDQDRFPDEWIVNIEIRSNKAGSNLKIA